MPLTESSEPTVGILGVTVFLNTSTRMWAGSRSPSLSPDDRYVISELSLYFFRTLLIGWRGSHLPACQHQVKGEPFHQVDGSQILEMFIGGDAVRAHIRLYNFRQFESAERVRLN